MALRKIESIINTKLNLTAVVYRDADWDEYRVKHHVNGEYQAEADYHCDDKAEAQNHARSWAKFYN